MINLWTQEWGWSDWRRLNSHLNDKEAKALYLTEQAMYQDMHTQHVINNINTPAGGGATATTSGEKVFQFVIDTRLSSTTTVRQDFAPGDTFEEIDANYPADPTNDIYVIGHRASNGFANPPGTLSSGVYWRKMPVETDEYLTIDWGDGVVSTIGRNDNSQSGISDVWDRSYTYGNNFVSRFLWHRFPTPGEYTITVTGTDAFVESTALSLHGRVLNYKGNKVNAPASLDSSDYLVQYKTLRKITKLQNIGTTPWASGYNLLGMRDFRDIPDSDISIERNYFIQPFISLRSEEDYASWDEIKDPPSPATFGPNALMFIHTLGTYKFYSAIVEKDWSKENSLQYMFYRSDFGHTDDPVKYPVPDLSTMDVSNIVNMSHTFYDCKRIEDDALNMSNWDTSNVLYLDSCFRSAGIAGASARSVANWNLNSLLSVNGMFRFADLTDADLEYILKGWADNSNTASSVDATNIATSRTYSAGSDADLAIQTLTAKGWTFSGITIS